MQSRDLDETKAAYKKVFASRKSNRQFENVTGFGGFGQFQSVAEGENVPLMSAPQLYDKKFTHTKYAGAWQVTEEMEDDDQYEFVAGLARAFARAFRFTKEVDLSNVFNNSFGTETAADGSAICASHTLWGATAIDNSVSSDLSASAAQTAYNHFATLTDDQGLRIGLAPKYIVAAPAMRWVVGETFRSEFDTATAGSNKINVLYEETIQEIYWAEITDTDAWWLLASPDAVNGMGLRLYNRQDFTTSSDFDPRNLTMLSVGRGRWSRGCVDWRQLYGSQGS
jgi:hypothetical protein